MTSLTVSFSEFLWKVRILSFSTSLSQPEDDFVLKKKVPAGAVSQVDRQL